jgi:hypothetical protein
VFNDLVERYRGCADDGGAGRGSAVERVSLPDGEDLRMIAATLRTTISDVMRIGYQTLTCRGCRIVVWREGHGDDDGVRVHMAFDRAVVRTLRGRSDDVA